MMLFRRLRSIPIRTLSTKPNIKECDARPAHIPVMANETTEYLDTLNGSLFLDMTFGAGGHTTRILESNPKVRVIGLDRDPTAHDIAVELSNKYPGRLIPLLGRFSELPELLKKHDIKQNTIDGMLFDFGCSSMQFDSQDRGFSINSNSYLDMRMDRDRFPAQPTVAEVLAKIDEPSLARILKNYGDEKCAKKIARAVIDARYAVKKIETTKELADLVYACCGGETRLDKLQRPSHVATKTFQALRIFVNNELNEINYGMIVADKFLKIGGRLVTITFHSLEDTIVKRHLMGNLLGDVANPISLKFASHLLCHDKSQIEDLMTSNWHQLHKHVLTPKLEEIEENPRSRSAKFRASVKIR